MIENNWIHWKEYNFDKLRPRLVKKNPKSKDFYDDNIYTLDLETSSFYIKDGKVLEFDFTKVPAWYKDCVKGSLVYIWQFSINDIVIYGRELLEMKSMLEKLHARIPVTKLIFVHNLSYEFQFIRNIISDLSVLARKPRSPMTATVESLGIEFRCSYMLTGLPLSKLPKAYGFKVQKLEGFNYTTIRTPLTVLSDFEQEYCRNDCLVVYEVIKKHLEQYKSVCKIPLTSTGKVRRKVKSLYVNNKKFYQNMAKRQPSTVKEFKDLIDCFAGGYTHANSLLANQIVDNVKSFDIASSYPAVMLLEKFPMTRFENVTLNTLDDMDRSNFGYIVEIKFKNLTSTNHNTYLSVSKAKSLIEPVVENGRVVESKEALYILNEIDLEIVEKNYSFDYEIISSTCAWKDYLDMKFIKFILELYNNKTKLKGSKEHEDLYNISKTYINALYGMCVTNTIRDEVTYNGDWEVTELTTSDIQSLLQENIDDEKMFTSYSWGVWVTAYARRNLWRLITPIDADVVYCDTDSVKFIDEYDEHGDLFDNYNKRNMEKIQRVAKLRKLDPELFYPIDPSGVTRAIGHYEEDGEYDRFITLGAKKYAYEVNGKISITVSGVSKSGSKALTRLEDFSSGFLFDYHNSGKMTMNYIEDQSPIVVDGYVVRQQYGICATPTTYKLGITVQYQDYIDSVGARHSTHATVLVGKERW